MYCVSQLRVRSSVTEHLFTVYYFDSHRALLIAYNVPMDYFTLLMFMWNFGAMGMICIHWKGPLIVQQVYMIVISALFALMLIKYLPDWTTWTVLVIVALWGEYGTGHRRIVG